MEYQIWFPPQLRDLSPISAGECDQNALCRPTIVLSHYAIHCILVGTGTFSNQNGTYHLHAGQIFLTVPGDEFSFVHDGQHAFHMRWINFGGELSRHFDRLPKVIEAPDGFLNSFCDLLDKKHRVECLLSAQLLELYANLLPAPEAETGLSHVQRADQYIQENYMHPITVQSIADRMGLHRCYLSQVFRRAIGQTVQDHIIQTRLLNARQFLFRGYTVQETAKLCGFSSVSSFCRLFKKHDPQAMTPLQRQKRVHGIDLRTTMSPPHKTQMQEASEPVLDHK